MRKIITLSVCLFLIYTSYSQIPKLKEIDNLRDSEIIIGLSGNDALDESFKSIVSEYWKICPVTKELPYEEALEMAKKDENVYVIYYGSYNSFSFIRHVKIRNTEYSYQNISEGSYIGLSNGKKKPLIYSAIPIFDGKITEEAIAHGTNWMNQIFSMMLDEQVNAMKTFKIIKENGSELKDKTLYIPDWWIDAKLEATDISELYDGEIKIVNHQEWSQAILNKEEGVAYSIIIPAAVGGKFVYQHHLCDAATGKVLGFVQPKAPFALNGVNLSAKNTGYINKKNLKQYNDVLK